MNKWLKSIPLFAGSIALVVGISWAMPNDPVQGLFSDRLLAQSSNMTVLQPCIPTVARLRIARSSWVGKTSHQGREYNLIHVFDTSGQRFDVVVSTENGQCREDFFNPMGDRMPLHGSVPLPVAQQFALRGLQQSIQRDGKAKVVQRLHQAAAQGFTFYPEEIWALRQLGINLPNARIDSTTRSRG